MTIARRPSPGRDRGFTLIELLVVVIIVGVLAAIAVPVYLNQRTKAVNASMKADLKAMATAQETCIADDPSLTGIRVWTSAGGSVTVCGSGSSAVTVKASPGNVIEAYTHPFNANSVYAGTYCLVAYNPRSDARVVRGYDGAVIEHRYYYSGAGGGGAGGFTEYC